MIRYGHGFVDVVYCETMSQARATRDKLLADLEAALTSEWLSEDDGDDASCPGRN